MLLFAGLGNPGANYAHNRHNIGFMAIDAIHKAQRFPAFRSRFEGLIAEGDLAGTRVALFKPTTYMNDSGRAVAAAARFYKIATKDILVIHDELDLTPAKLRLKTGGGSAGHNGLRSISEQIGSQYRRLRLGIGHPGDKSLVHAHVLSNFDKSEQPWVNAVCRAIADNADLLVRGEDATFQNKVHRALEAEGLANGG
jgi:PTH1 family peptidyl-tRNA hydrolase